jgi:prepilin-type N-terminal cleavage/methylation domain-containing protein
MVFIKKQQAGFALIELILSMVVLSISMVGGFVLLQNTVSNSVSMDFNVVASQFANEKLEEVIAAKTFTGYAGVDNADFPSETMTAPYQNFTRTVNIYEVDPVDMTTAQVGSGYKKVTVSVVWGSQSYETINVVTVLTNYGS